MALTAMKRQRTDGALVPAVNGIPLQPNNVLTVNSEAVRRTSSLDAPIMLLTGHGSAVYTMKFNPQGTAIASGSHDKDICRSSCISYELMRYCGS
jgi:WD40 repeat protein